MELLTRSEASDRYSGILTNPETNTNNRKDKHKMNISKIKAAWAFLTDGWSGLFQYLLTVVNSLLAKCDAEKLKSAANIALGIAAIVKTACDTFAPDKYKAAAGKTIAALTMLASALEDGTLTASEIDANIKAISDCIDAWKEVK
jgi:hypothetical protein